jgi:hypothetical protein
MQLLSPRLPSAWWWNLQGEALRRCLVRGFAPRRTQADKLKESQTLPLRRAEPAGGGRKTDS